MARTIPYRTKIWYSYRDYKQSTKIPYGTRIPVYPCSCLLLIAAHRPSSVLFACAQRHLYQDTTSDTVHDILIRASFLPTFCFAYTLRTVLYCNLIEEYMLQYRTSDFQCA